MKKILSILLVLTMVFSLGAVMAEEATPETLIFKNGNIYTANANQDYVTAVVIQNGVFVYAGDDAGAAAYEQGVPEENIVDLGGCLVTPGLIEGHTHPFLIATMNANHFTEIPSDLGLEDALAEAKKYIAEHPEYDSYCIGNFAQTLDLTAAMLDEICPDKPLACFGAGFHCAYVNSKYMENGGINKDTPDAVPGQSYYVRDAEGNPTGKIIELVQTWISFRQAMPIDNELLKAEFKKIVNLYHSMGFIGMAEGGGVSVEEENALQVLRELEEADELDMIVCPATIWYGHTVSDITEVRDRALSQKANYTSELVYPGTIKMWCDGTTGALSALMKEPYEGTTTCGNEVTTPDDLIACAQMCKENDLNCHFHAIGDQAIDNALTAYETVGESTGTQSIVHFTVSGTELIERAAKIPNLIINFTPNWANAMIDEDTKQIGDRRNIYCLFGEAMNAGITVNFGSDSNGTPESWDPAMNILVAMFRDPDKEGIFLKGEPCSFENAVDAYSINVAKERRIDDKHGSIEVGKNADLVIWDVDCFDEELYENSFYSNGLTTVVTTLRTYAQACYLNGKCVYRR